MRNRSPQCTFQESVCGFIAVVFAVVLVIPPPLGAASEDPPATAQQIQPVRRMNATSFHSVAGLTKIEAAQPALRGARVANPDDWPASFYSVHTGGSCTATLVGPRALLTAAHCVANGGSATVTLAGTAYEGTCMHSEAYPRDKSADWAMCLMRNEVPVDQYETVSTDPSRLAIGKEILLTGFGCTTSTGMGGNDRNYRIGEATVDKLPADNNDIQTVGEVALCFGDSGGPAFIYLDAAKKRRVQVSVNSRVEKKPNGTLGQRSFLSSLSTRGALAFLAQWATASKTEVCGVNSNTTKCRK